MLLCSYLPSSWVKYLSYNFYGFGGMLHNEVLVLPGLGERGALFGVENPRRQYTLLEAYSGEDPSAGSWCLRCRPLLVRC